MVARGYEIYLLVSVEISFVSPRGDVISSIYRPDSQGNLSLVIFSSPRVTEIPGRSRSSQSCDEKLCHVDSPSGFTRIFILE